jgi:hypothetical protein
MRSLVDHPAKEAFKYSGLTDDQITRMLELVNLFKTVISLTDQAARAPAGNAAQFADLQSKKDLFLSRAMTEFITKSIGASGTAKFRSFMNSSVKRRTKRISYAGHDVYVFCNAWQDTDTVHGYAILISDYGDHNEYQVKATVIAPDGVRSLSRQSPHQYAPVSVALDLPLALDDGNFSIQSIFALHQRDLASATNVVSVPAFVRVGAVLPAAIELPTPSANVISNFRFTAQIIFSRHAPRRSTAVVELNEGANLNQVTFEVDPPSGAGVSSRGNSRIAFVAGGPGSRTITWSIRVTSAGSTHLLPVASVTNEIRIESAQPKWLGIGTNEVPVVFTLAQRRQP